jgi:hypothetical protein
MTQVDKMKALEQRIDALDKECSELSTRRESLAIDFSAGNKNAQRQCEQIDTAYDAAWKERSLLMSAREQLLQLAADEQQAILDKAEEEHRAKAADCAASISTLNESVDAQLKKLSGDLAARAELLRQLQNSRVCDPGYLNRLGRSCVTSAFAAAGLNKYIAMDTPAPTSIMPLSKSNHVLSSIGKPPKVRAD